MSHVQSTPLMQSKSAEIVSLPQRHQLIRAVGNPFVYDTELSQIIAQRRLFPLFQPIAMLTDGSVYAHEALIRGPDASRFYTPDALFAQASEEALGFELELACLVVILQRWGELKQRGRLFVNISAQAMVRLIQHTGLQQVIRLMRRWGISCRQLVLEITEHERVLDMPALVDAAKAVRQLGIQIALDDFGDGRSSMQPRLIENKHNIDDLLGILTSDDQRYLSDGFIVVENGRYRGLCRGDQIVKSVTETRIEAARHANPLTFLPGNIPITQHIDRMLARGSEFMVCYLDLNNFKSFNDRYGYWRGDEMIRLVAKVAGNHLEERRDFLGHVGGDDFIVVFQSADWAEHCRSMIDEFNAQAAMLFDPADRQKGGIEAEDRQGFTQFFPLTSLSIGAVHVRAGQFKDAEQVANAAAAAKHTAKKSESGLAVSDGH